MRLRSIAGSLGLCAICLVLGARSAVAQTEPGILGARRYLQFCAACHGSDGRGGDKAASLVASPAIRARSDDDLFRIVHDGTADGMPPFAQIGDANIHVLVHFLRVLQNASAPAQSPVQAVRKGDPAAGRTLFFGKAQCAACHRFEGQGSYIASDLTGYGRTHDIDTALRAIVDPDALSMPSSRMVTVTTKKGQTLTGVLKNEDGFSLDLQAPDGRYYLLDRSDLVHLTDSGRSFMPRDYSRLLSPGELDDIAGFLRAAAHTTPQLDSEQQ